jgi:hypothetical protein
MELDIKPPKYMKTIINMVTPTKGLTMGLYMFLRRIRGGGIPPPLSLITTRGTSSAFLL